MLQPQELAAKCAAVGNSKAKLPVVKTLLLAVLAGFFISFGAAGFNTAISTIASPSAGRVVGACIFPTGLSLVLICGSELFTGNNMTLPMAGLYRMISLYDIVRNWILVFIGNFIGALFIAGLCAYGKMFTLFNNGLAVTTFNVAIGKINHSFGEAIALGILCNLLVCLAVWMSFAGENPAEKIIALFLPIMVFVLCGFEHSVANMFFIPAAIFLTGNPEYVLAAQDAGISLDILTWPHFLMDNLLPVTIGNIIGGVIIALLYALIYPNTEKARR